MLTLLLHGYGSTGSKMREALHPWPGELGRCLAPDGVLPCTMFPEGRQWFEFSLDRDRLAKATQDRGEAIAALLEREREAGEPVLVIGHSQGALIAGFLALTGRLGFGRALCVSGYLPFTPAILCETPAPVTFLHGRADNLVKEAETAKNVQVFRDAGAPIRFEVEEEGGHILEGALAARTRSIAARIAAECKPALVSGEVL